MITSDQFIHVYAVKPVLRGHSLDKEKNGLIKQVDS